MKHDPQGPDAPRSRRVSRVETALRAFLLALLGAWCLFKLLSLTFPFPPKLLGEIDNAKNVKRGVLLTAEQACAPEWVAIDDVSPRLVDAIIAVEDKRFYQHGGVDPIAVARAVAINFWRMRTFSGASTITMQTVKNMRRRANRGFRDKLVEVFRAIQLEEIKTKREIMEAYLNLIHFDARERGVSRAALKYFGKHPGELDLAEAALLAGILNKPGFYDPNANPTGALERRNFVLWRMLQCGQISGDEYRRTVSVKLALYKN